MRDEVREERMGELRVRIAGGTTEPEAGDGPVVVLLHGWAAPGDDLVPLWRVIDAPRGTTFVFPEGPLPVETGLADSRAWWRIDEAKLEQDFASGRPRNLSREVPEGLTEARDSIIVLLDELVKHFGVSYEHVVLGGFSQGAMLACDVALRTEVPLGGVAVLSGTVLARDQWLPLMPKRKGLPVLQSHGTMDPVLPFFLAEQLRDFLTDAGVAMQWHGFEGGHEIPPEILDRLGAFIRNVAR